MPSLTHHNDCNAHPRHDGLCSHTDERGHTEVFNTEGRDLATKGDDLLHGSAGEKYGGQGNTDWTDRGRPDNQK